MVRTLVVEAVRPEMRMVMRPFWRLFDGARDRAACALENLSQALYRLEERMHDERTLTDHHETD